MPTDDDDYLPTDDQAPDAPPPKTRVRKLRQVAANEQGGDWRLVRNKDLSIRSVIANAMYVFATAQEWQGVVAYNAFDGSVVKLKDPPMNGAERPADFKLGEWTDVDTSLATAWLSRQTDSINLSPKLVGRAIYAVAQRNEFHPVRDYLRGLEWDRTPRTEKWLSTYLGAASTPYIDAIGARWLISAIARVMDPGCKADHMLVFEGAQGIGKSTALEALAGPEWFCDTPVTFGEKDSYEALRGVWIYELAELAGLRRSDIEAQKAYISKKNDRYRRPYGEGTTTWPRQVVFAGTTNDQRYLTDPTGNRRFWPVACGDVRLDAIRADRDQLWAEALIRYQQKEAWHLDTPELTELAASEQAERVSEDDWETLLSRWMQGDAAKYIIDKGEGLATADVLTLGLGLKAEKIGRAETTRAGIVLKRLGWGARRKIVVTGGEREWRLFRSE